MKKLSVNANEENFEELFQEYRPLVLSLMKTYYLKDFDYDDWLQEGRIAFYKAHQGFDNSHQTTFGAYFKRVLKNHICSLVRKQEAVKRRADKKPLHMDDDFYEMISQTLYESMDYDQQLIICESLNQEDQIFSSLEGQVISGYILGKEITDLARDLLISEDKVRNTLDRSRRKLKTHLQVL